MTNRCLIASSTGQNNTNVAPLHTAAMDRDWCTTHHLLVERVQRVGLNHLAFTLPEQAGNCFATRRGISAAFASL